MLSGFGMVRGYEAAILQNDISFTEYIRRRLKRLLPLSWITLGVITVLQFIYRAKVGTTFVYSNFDFYHFILNLLGMQNGVLGTDHSFNAPSWCVSVSIFCYILFYIIVARARALESARELHWIYLGTGIAGCGLIVSKVSAPIVTSAIATGISYFFIGCFLAKTIPLIIHKERIGYLSVGGLILSGILIAAFGTGGNLGLLTAFCFAPLLILSVLYVPWLRRLCEWKVFNYLGKISFEIYLWHFPVQCLIKIIDIYFGLHINYSTKQVWILYAVSVLFVSVLYKRYVAPRLVR